MKERIKAVGFYARAESHWKSILSETCAGLLGLTVERIPTRWHDAPILRSLVREEFRVLSYMLDWKEAFSQSPRFAITWSNVNNLYEYNLGLRALKEVPLAIILHSAAWDHMALLRMAVARFQARRGKLLIFYGNEYHNMTEKTTFARAVGADYIASQLPLQSAAWLYAECKGSRVLPAPAALNPDLYRPGQRPRPIDIGFRGDLYGDHALGDRERSAVLSHFDTQADKYGLVKDILFTRYPRDQWSGFLSRCKGIVGAESGTHFLERDDQTRRAVIRYLKRNPTVRFEEVYERFFKRYPNPVSGKAISSRHFEPIGTQTCQLLLEGHYNGILKADEHYISIKTDLSNVDEAIRKFKDEDYRKAMVDRTHEYVLERHTYRHRVDEIATIMVGNGVG